MQQHNQFERIAKAIEYIKQNFKTQPNLDEVAAHIHLSPAHFQRLFTQWAGTSPKKFLQYISIEHAKSMLKQAHSVFDATYDTGLSSTSRLHDLFIQIEGMTPAEYQSGGENLTIHYQYAETQFGTVLVASTEKGICFMSFVDTQQASYAALLEKFPKARFYQQADVLHEHALAIFSSEQKPWSQIKLHLKGTDFQLKVWESLLKIPMGQLATYADLAEQIGNPNASRAVGTAIGNNPVAFLIPCHRVIQATGVLGEYHWGKTRKVAMIGWEGVQAHVKV